MARDDGGAAGTVIVAFVLGALTGAAVALLMAPASGEETRRILAEKAREGRQRASEAARQGREFVNRQKDTISTAIERGRDAYEQARDAAAPPAGGPAETLCEQRLVRPVPRRHRGGDAGDGAGPGWRDDCGAAARAAGAAGDSDRCSRTCGRSSRARNAIAEEASRTVALATAQAQKVDRLVTDLSQRVDETAAVLQEAIITPAREGLAIVAARQGRPSRRCAACADSVRRNGRHAEEEDPLFIG